MKKVGILTYHRTINYGAFLQCYSLMSTLAEKEGLEVEVIDCNTKIVEKANLKHCLSKDFFTIFKKLNRRNIFNASLKKYMNLSNTHLYSDNYDELIDFINSRNCDFIVIGSDEVFKIDSLRPFPNFYWPDERIKAKVITYAASGNRTHFAKFNESEKNEIKRRLSRIEYLTVRDENTYKSLLEIDSSLNVKKVPDPTFSYKFPETPKLKQKLLKKYGLDLNKPIMGLDTMNMELSQLIRDHYGNDYQIVSIYLFNKYAHKFLYDLEPFEWAKIYSYFDINITTLFHGTIFSIRNRTPFISVDDEAYYLTHESKIKNLLTRGNLQDNLFNLQGDFNPDELIKRINYISTNKQEQISLMENFESKELNILNSAIFDIVEIIKSN